MSLMSIENPCLVTNAINRGQSFVLTEAGKLVLEQIERSKQQDAQSDKEKPSSCGRVAIGPSLKAVDQSMKSSEARDPKDSQDSHQVDENINH
jgi:hypothetical protein